MTRTVFYVQPAAQLRPGGIPPEEHHEWSIQLPERLLLPDITSEVPSLTIEYAAVFTCVEILPEYTAGTRYLNPPQSQIGYYHELYNDFVSSHGRIEYAQQVNRVTLPVLHLAGSWANRQRRLRLEDNGGYWQLTNSRTFTMCDVERETSTGTARGSSAQTGELVARIEYGQLQLAAMAPTVGDPALIDVEGGVQFPSSYRGVVWPGWAGTLAFEFAFYSDLHIPSYTEDWKNNPGIPPDVAPICEGGGGGGDGGPVVEYP